MAEFPQETEGLSLPGREQEREAGELFLSLPGSGTLPTLLSMQFFSLPASPRLLLTGGSRESLPPGGVIPRDCFVAYGEEEAKREDGFDGVVQLLTMDLLSDRGDKVAWLRYLRSRLKPGGSLLLYSLVGLEDDPSRRETYGERVRRYGELSERGESEKSIALLRSPGIHSVTEQRLLNLLDAAGFQGVERLFHMYSLGAWSGIRPAGRKMVFSTSPRPLH